MDMALKIQQNVVQYLLFAPAASFGPFKKRKFCFTKRPISVTSSVIEEYFLHSFSFTN